MLIVLLYCSRATSCRAFSSRSFEHAVLLERLDDVRLQDLAERIDRRAVVEQAALRRFLLPLVRVVVAVEDDPLVLLDQLREQRS